MGRKLMFWQRQQPPASSATPNKTLKLCPFCKGRPKVFTAFGTNVECQACGAKVYDLDEETAIAKWNRRVSYDADQS